MKEKPYVQDGNRMSRDEYNRIKFDRFLLTVEKGKAEEISSFAKKLGMTRNEYISYLIHKDMSCSH